MVTLNPTLNPIDARERVHINQNWDRITLRFSQLQSQINILSGEATVEEILQELNNAISNANTTVQGLVNNSEAAIRNVNQKIIEVDNKLAELQTAINDANAATTATNSAISDARQAISDINNILDNFDFTGVYSATTNYRKNNFVRLNKDTYVALKNNLGIAPSDDGVNWRLVAVGGIDGQGAVNTVNNLEPDSNGNVQLPIENVQNFGIATQAEAEASIANDKYMTPLRSKQLFDRNLTPLQTQFNEHLGQDATFKSSIKNAAYQDYEEGAWTPTLTGSSVAGSAIYAIQNGKYTKVGNIVTCTFNIVLSSKSGMTGGVTIGGLPFPIAASTLPSLVLSRYAFIQTGGKQLSGYGLDNSNVMTLRLNSDNADHSPVDVGLIANNTSIVGSITYLGK